MWVSDTMRAAQVREIYETAIEEQEEGGLGDEGLQAHVPALCRA